MSKVTNRFDISFNFDYAREMMKPELRDRIINLLAPS